MYIYICIYICIYEFVVQDINKETIPFDDGGLKSGLNGLRLVVFVWLFMLGLTYILHVAFAALGWQRNQRLEPSKQRLSEKFP